MVQPSEEQVQAALVDLNALISPALAEQQIARVSISQIQIIAATHLVQLQRDATAELEGFYRDYLRNCLRDRAISEEEADSLAHLKHILGLNDQVVSRIHNEVAQAIYEAGVEEVISDGRLDPAEQRFLEKLQYDLRLPDDMAQQIYQQEAEDYLQQFYRYATADERLSPEEGKELNAIAQSLGVDLPMDTYTQAALNRYRLYWVIDNGKLPTLEVDLDLPAGEVCYFTVEASWYERRQAQPRDRLGHIHFYRAAYQNLIDLKPCPLNEADWQPIDNGPVYLTNRRLILAGQKETTALGLDRVLDIKACQNGLEVISRSGPSPFVAFETGVDILALLMGRAIRDLG
ncbi:MAG: hypothetical protein GYB66_14505 [Chloroflexi bacterium]|nr:hypothetical protein [Chloroflexota bacterium]